MTDPESKGARLPKRPYQAPRLIGHGKLQTLPKLKAVAARTVQASPALDLRAQALKPGCRLGASPHSSTLAKATSFNELLPFMDAAEKWSSKPR